MTDFWTKVLNLAETTAARVGTQLMADFGLVQASEKADGSLVTQSDKWADLEIQKAIASVFPEHGILSEEGEHIFPDTEWCWIIDPLDGTTNFARGIPIWAISIALFYQGSPVFGYVSLPPIGQIFHAFADFTNPQIPNLQPPSSGAFVNNRPIHASSDAITSNHFFSFCSRSIFALKHPFPCKIRMLGVASYNFLMVAAGLTIGGVEATPKIWDIAAVWAIAHAAGAVWVPLDSDPIFPLTPGKDYSTLSYPTLAVSQAELVPTFQSLIEELGKK